MSLNTTKQPLDEIDRGIFEVLRLKIVAGGYFPNEPDFLPANESGFQSAKDAIISGGKELIELFGTGDADSSEDIKGNMIWIERNTVEPASTGIKQHDFIELKSTGPNVYTRKRSQDTNYDITYDVRYVTKSTKYGRIIEQLLIETFGTRKYLNAIDSNGDNTSCFWIKRVNQFDVSGPDFMERGISLMAENINLEGSTIVRDDIAQITDFDLVPVPRTTEDIDITDDLVP